MDLMATPASAQYAPATDQEPAQQLPFYSQYHTSGSAGVDVFSHNVSRMPGEPRPCFGFCFPPPQMVGVVLQHLAECKARAVVIVPDQRQVWFPLLSGAIVRSVAVSEMGDEGVFFRLHHQKGHVPVVFQSCAMRAVEIDFRNNT